MVKHRSLKGGGTVNPPLIILTDTAQQSTGNVLSVQNATAEPSGRALALHAKGRGFKSQAGTTGAI